MATSKLLRCVGMQVTEEIPLTTESGEPVNSLSIYLLVPVSRVLSPDMQAFP